MAYPNPTGTFPLTLSSGQLTDSIIGFPVTTEAQWTASLQKFNMLVQTGGLAGQTLAQVLSTLLGFLDANAEVVPAPTLAVVGGAGSTTRHYAAVCRYPLVPGPGLGSIGATQFLPGTPPEGRLPNYGLGVGQQPSVNAAPFGQSGRKYRYSLLGTQAVNAATPAALSATNYVNITAPASSTVCTAAGTTPTFDIVATDGAGNVLYWVALGVAAGAVVSDTGANLSPNTLPYTKNAHAEACVGPTTGSALYAPPTSTAEGGIY